MKVLLDIDGVMVPANAWRRPEILADGFPAFSSKASGALQRILSETNADVVLTSSHKSSYSTEQWINLFRSRGIDVKKMARLPDNTNRLSRKDELLKWFRVENVNGDFVIIDDDKSLNALPPSLKEKLVLTSGAIGLTNELANEAIAILTRNTASAA